MSATTIRTAPRASRGFLLVLFAWFPSVTATAREMPLAAPLAAGSALEASAVVAADFDGDGDTDLATASPSQGEIFWLEDTGAGFVQHTVDMPSATPRLLASADIDCDGVPDLIVGDDQAGLITVRLNVLGGMSWTDGGFVANPVTGLLDLEVVDLDGNGSPDVAAGLSTGEIMIWRQSSCGSGAWISSTVASGLLAVPDVVAADLNRDGRPDLAAISTVGDAVSWWENPGGPGGWPSHGIESALGGGESMTVGDVDGDGDLDLAAGNDSGELAWWTNSGDGSIWTRVPVASAPSPSVSLLADADGDGDLDLFVANPQVDEPLVWWDNLSGDGTTWVQHTIDLAPGMPRGLLVTDLGPDGDPDLATAAFLAGEVKVYENDSTARSAYLDEPLFNSSYPFALREIPDHDVGDVDGDGDLDLVLVEQDSSIPQAFVIWLENAGLDSQGTPVLAGPHFVHLETLRSSRSVTTGDVDGDGDLDIFLGNQETLTDHVVFCRNDGPPSWTCLGVISTSLPEAIVDLILADLDGDGDLDLLAAPADGLGVGSVAWWEQDGDPSSAASWIRHDIENPSSGLRSLAVADLEGDGDLDVVARGKAWLNDGGSWTSSTVSAGLIEGFAVADIDGDGDVDVAAVSGSISGLGLSWFENDLGGPSGTWIERVIRAPDLLGAFGAMAPADLDRDGDVDLVVRRFTTTGDGTFWYENDATGSAAWPRHEVFPATSDVEKLSVADLDGDGDGDLLGVQAQQLFGIWINGGGQFALGTSELVPPPVHDGDEVAVFHLEVHHRGRSGDSDLVLADLALLFESSPGVPLSDTDLQTAVATLRIYADDGSGDFDPSLDTELAALSPPPLAAGLGVLSLPDHGALHLPPEASPAAYFLTVQMGPGASTLGLPSLRLTHTPSAGSAADEADYGTPLLLEHSLDASVTLSIFPPEIFFDGFESGDVSAWSSTLIEGAAGEDADEAE